MQGSSLPSIRCPHAKRDSGCASHVDAEGHDYEVLKTLDFAKHAPLSIFVEHKYLSDAQNTEMLHLLHKNGYSVRDCG